MVGVFDYADAGIPPAGAACTSTTFVFDGESESAWVNLSGTAFVGSVSVTAHGGSLCETAITGGGAVVLSVSGSGATGSLQCDSLEGAFTRTASDMTITVAGDCSINGTVTPRIGFIARGDFVPTALGAGVNEPITEAQFAGAFTILPT